MLSRSEIDKTNLYVIFKVSMARMHKTSYITIKCNQSQKEKIQIRTKISSES